MPAPVLQFKRGNAGVAGTVPALRPGEPAISLNNFDFFIGIDTSVANNKFFGSHRYWGREDGTTSLRLKLVDKDGSNYLAIKSPNTLAGIVTYVLPGTQGTSSSVLTNDGNGNLSWSSGSANPTFTGIATFSDTTDNTLGNANTGAVQIKGGLGVTKNVTVGANLNVQGYSEFVGVVTFRGGTINIGDSNTDNINVAGEFVSNLTPNDDNTYDIGIGTQRWRNANFAGIVTVGSFVNNGTSTINGNVQINSNLNVNGNITLGGTSYYNASTTTLIRDKDIVLGVTTDTTFYPDTSTDNTANHGGISVASTQGTPLVSLQAVGINSLPDTYKQIMWMKSGTWTGLGTDAWMFNYGVGIGSTQVPYGVRLAVGGVQVTDTAITATTGSFTTLTGSVTGTISTATRATTVDTTTTTTNQFYAVPFVTNFIGTNGETVRVGTGLSVNPSNGNAKSAGDLIAGSGYLASANGTRSMFMYDTSGDVSFQGKVIANNFRSQTNASNTLTFADLDATFARHLLISGIATVTGNLSVNGGTVASTSGVATVFDTTVTTANAFGQATAIGIGSTAATLTLRPSTVVGTNATQNLYNSVATNLNFGGAATALVMGASTGIATINNATLTLPNATTVNVNGANPTLASSSTGTLTLFNANLTTVNAFGAATSIGIGANSGTATINNATVTLANATTFNINGANPTLASSSTGILTLFNTNLTKVNAFQAATDIVLAATTGVTTVRNNLQVNGTSTFAGSITGTISTATRASLVDTTTAPNGTFYPGLFVNSTGTASTAVYVDAGISYVSNTDTLTLTGDIAVNGGDVTTSATTFNLINGTATNVNFGGAATALVMGAATGITTVRNKLIVSGNLEVDGNNIQASDGNNNITLTSNTLTTFAGDIRVNGNDIQASDGNVNITMTSNTLTEVKGDLKVTGNDIQSSTATALTLSGADVTVAGDLTVGGNDIKASNGTTALTLATTGAVTAANDLTVTGNLYVNGSTTQVNTAALTVEDRTIDLGIVDGAVPASNTTWDLGVLFNYYSGGAAKKSAVVWEHGDSRFKFASVLASDTNGTTNDTPQLTVTTFAPIEVSELWINNTCTGGTKQVIGCVGSELQLQNITVDAGTF